MKLAARDMDLILWAIVCSWDVSEPGGLHDHTAVFSTSMEDGLGGQRVERLEPAEKVFSEYVPCPQFTL